VIRHGIGELLCLHRGRGHPREKVLACIIGGYTP
jgi:hypothetical protein